MFRVQVTAKWEVAESSPGLDREDTECWGGLVWVCVNIRNPPHCPPTPPYSLYVSSRQKVRGRDFVFWSAPLKVFPSRCWALLTWESFSKSGLNKQKRSLKQSLNWKWIWVTFTFLQFYYNYQTSLKLTPKQKYSFLDLELVDKTKHGMGLLCVNMKTNVYKLVPRFRVLSHYSL